jgi:hypothetical protein
MFDRRISAYQPGSTSSTKSEPPPTKVPTLSPPPTFSPSPQAPLPPLTPKSSPPPTPLPSPLPSFPSAPPLNLTASSPTLPTIKKIDPPKEVMAPSLLPLPPLSKESAKTPSLPICPKKSNKPKSLGKKPSLLELVSFLWAFS